MTHNYLRYEFGPYQLDPTQRILTRNGEGIPLTPKATGILMVLVKHAGQLVEKDELLREVWPDTFVEEVNLSQNVFTLRRALGDDRTGPKYIETIARRGYRFIGSVKTINPESTDFSDSVDDNAKRPVVVVLPFQNHTGDAEFDYLANGLTHNVINNLSRVSQLRVMSHSAAFRYIARERDSERIGKELHANAVLVTNINARRNGIAINVELVDVVAAGSYGARLGRLQDSLSKLRQAASLEGTGPLATGRCYHEWATTLKELANAERDERYADEAALNFQRALYRFEAVGHHRYVAAIENNLGFLLLSLAILKESEQHLLRSKRLFECLSDSVHGAQTNETLARLYLETKQFALAKEAIDCAVKTLDLTDG
jgi:DNA-binding winged helix-turn-helix (wHTH) protein